VLDNVPLPENPAGLVYGTILAATLLAAEYSRRETYLTTVGAVVVALIMYWLALAYSEFTGRRLKDAEHFTLTAFWKAAKHENSVLMGAGVPIVVIIVCGIFGVDLASALEIGVYTAAGIIVVFEVLIGLWSDGAGIQLVWHTIIGILLGLMIVLLRVLLH
jgi:hypothetical protein